MQPQRAGGPDRAGRDAGRRRADAEVGQRAVARAEDERQLARSSPAPRAPSARERHGVLGRRQRRSSCSRAIARDLERLVEPLQRLARSSGRWPMPDECSVIHAPVMRCTTSSLTPHQRATRACSSGSSSRNHTNLVSGDIGCSGVPVCAVQVRALAPAGARPARDARWSAHVSRSVSGAPSASRPTSECSAVENDRPATSRPASRAAASARARRRDHRVDDDARLLHRPAGLAAPAAGTRPRSRRSRGRRRRTRPPWRTSSRCRSR